MNNTAKIDEIFDWGNQNEQLQFKAKVINDNYQLPTDTEDKMITKINGLKKKISSVFLESFLFYSGFYTPLWYVGNGKMHNVAEIIKLIIRDEAVHGTYLGYKFEVGYNELPEKEQQELYEWALNLLDKLYENEVVYTKEVYSDIGWVEEVLTYVQYNANKAMQNLGFEGVFEEGTAENVNPVVMNGISTESSNHDFFSSVGNSYLMGEAEAMSDDDYDF